MRIALRCASPLRTLLCGNAFRVHVDISATVFDELRELCAAAGDKASLAIGMAGLGQEHMMHGRMREASRLASETMALVESIGDPTLTVALSLAAIATKTETGEMAETLRLSQTVIDLADGDPTKGNIVFGSPLAMALATRGTALWALGRAGWRDDYDRALAMARSADPMSHASVITYAYGFAIPAGVLLADDAALRDIEEALEITERSSEDFALGLARWALGVALVHRESPAERERGLAVLGQVRDMCLNGRLLSVHTSGRRRVRPRGSGPGAATATVPYPKCAQRSTICSDQDISGLGVPATGVLVETLLDRGSDGDVVEAEAAIDRLAAAPGR